MAFKEIRPYAHTIDVLSQKFKNKLVVKKLFEMHVDIPNIELILGQKELLKLNIEDTVAIII
jgi:hypothetical protein